MRAVNGDGPISNRARSVAFAYVVIASRKVGHGSEHYRQAMADERMICEASRKAAARTAAVPLVFRAQAITPDLPREPQTVQATGSSK